MGAYSTAVLALSPAQFLELQEAAAGTADDSSSNSRDGTLYDPITYQQASLLAAEPSVFSLTIGTGGAIDTTFAGWTGSLTAVGWARRASTTGNHCLVGGDSVLLRCNTGVQTCSWFPDTGGGGVTWTGTPIPTASEFMWALTYNNSTFGSELFINGVSQGTKTNGSGFNAPGDVMWGTWGGGGTNADPFGGRISHEAFFPSILSGADILNLYNIGLSGVIQTLLPDADVVTTGWTTTPLFSKVNDSSDATVITATGA